MYCALKAKLINKLRCWNNYRRAGQANLENAVVQVDHDDAGNVE